MVISFWAHDRFDFSLAFAGVLGVVAQHLHGRFPSGSGTRNATTFLPLSTRGHQEA